MKNVIKVMILGIFIMVVLMPIQSCNDDDDTTVYGNWVKTIPFAGAPRSGTVYFTIGDKVYAGLGYNPNSVNSEYVTNGYFKDFYVYDESEGYWLRRASFPGVLRERGIAFNVDGKGYIGLGYNRYSGTILRDVWEYDPEEDTWEQKDDFLGSPRYNAVGFVIDNKGYVGTGYDDAGNINSDFYEYTPSEDSWTQIKSYPGDKRESAFSFVLNGKVYIGGGTSNSLYSTDFFEYDPITQTWTNLEIKDEDDSYYDEFRAAVLRKEAVAFTLENKGYIATGIGSGGGLTSTVYEYNPVTMAWTEKTAFEGASRSLAMVFVLNEKAFVGIGQNGTSRYDDVWEFRPNEEEDEDD
jgi:N-acetylneuraminic acid mutarotase